MLLIIHLAILALFLGLGFVFRRGKGAFLISGYNTATKAQRERIDERKLCRYTSQLMFSLTPCWAVIAAGTMLDLYWLSATGFCLFLAVSAFYLVYMNTGGRILK